MGQTRRGQWKREKIHVRTRKYAPELSVVRAAAGGVDETPGNARNEELVGDHELSY